MARGRTGIQWKKGDYIKLGKAVSAFNKKIKELENEENKLFLPDFQNYQSMKENIKTRDQLNKYINSLKRFQKENASELYINNEGQVLTKWEIQEITKAQKRAGMEIAKDLYLLNTPLDNKFSKAQMGNIEGRKLEAQFQNLYNYTNFKAFTKKMKKYFNNDTSYMKAIIFKNNFMESLLDLASNHEEFKEVYNYFQKINNPYKFYEEAQKSRALQDFFQWYLNPEGYGNFTINGLVDNIMNDFNEKNETIIINKEELKNYYKSYIYNNNLDKNFKSQFRKLK